jgi:hypothetical protein
MAAAAGAAAAGVARAPPCRRPPRPAHPPAQWSAVERTPRSYNWAGYRQLVQLLRPTGLRLQVVLSFHACGGNVGDLVRIPLPEWVLKVSLGLGVFLGGCREGSCGPRRAAEAAAAAVAAPVSAQRPLLTAPTPALPPPRRASRTRTSSSPTAPARARAWGAATASTSASGPTRSPCSRGARPSRCGVWARPWGRRTCGAAEAAAPALA